MTGSIAAYKAAEMASKLTQLGANVHVILTQNACQFVSPLTFRSLTGNQPLIGLFDEPAEGRIAHVDIPESTDLLLIAPATANIIGKMAHGIADDWLSTAALVVRCPVIIAPAMNRNMYTHPTVVENIEKLKAAGCEFVEPASGRLACGTEGVGRLADIGEIVERVKQALSPRKRDLAHMKLLVTAGPTREPIDAVRFISNRSSGKMGYAIADAAGRRGAQVTLVSGPTDLPPPANVNRIAVQTAAEMRDAALAAFRDADVVIAAAAVADFTPAKPSARKVKRTTGPWALDLLPAPDILKEMGAAKGKRVLVGFAAETGNLIQNASAKLKEKNLDLIVANEVFQEETVFGSDMNTAVLIASNGETKQLPRMSKRELADKILDHIRKRFWRKDA